jgi:uncharacterized Zn finger protein
MPHIETRTMPASSAGVMSHCPECSAGLVVMSIIPGRVGRGGCEYWTMRCTRCGGIHLDIVEPVSGAPAE